MNSLGRFYQITQVILKPVLARKVVMKMSLLPVRSIRIMSQFYLLLPISREESQSLNNCTQIQLVYALILIQLSQQLDQQPVIPEFLLEEGHLKSLTYCTPLQNVSLEPITELSVPLMLNVLKDQLKWKTKKEKTKQR